MVMADGQFTLPLFFLGKLEQAVNQSFVHRILSLVTDNSVRYHAILFWQRQEYMLENVH